MECFECGKHIESLDAIDHDGRIVNPGMSSEKVFCQGCFEWLWDRSLIIMCEACGNWYMTSDLTTGDYSFTPCPDCGMDIVEGTSLEEYMENYTASTKQLRHFVIEASSDGDLDLDVFSSHEKASQFINDRAVEIFDMWLDGFREDDLDICVSPNYARVSIIAPGHEFDRVLEYKPLEV